MSTTILTFDPGMATFGWAVLIVDGKEINCRAMGIAVTQGTPKKKRTVLVSDENFMRARFLARITIDLLAKWRPHALCAEAFSPPRAAASASKIAYSWGMLATVAESTGLPMAQPTPQQVKLHVAKSRSATKDEVAKAVRRRLLSSLAVFGDFDSSTHPDLQEHGYDAVAVGLTCIDSSEIIRAALR